MSSGGVFKRGQWTRKISRAKEGNEAGDLNDKEKTEHHQEDEAIRKGRELPSPLKSLMGLFSNRIARDDLRPGDHIYSWRTAYSYAHHGVFLFRSCISLIVFKNVVRGGTCTLALSDPAEEVLHRASYLLKNGFGCYHIFRKNCEDFAMYCKTGLLIVHGNTIGTSGQAVSILGAPLAAVASSPLGFLLAEPWGLVAVTAGMYCLSRYVADLGNRRDATKIPVEALVAKLSSSLTDSQSEIDQKAQ